MITIAVILLLIRLWLLKRVDVVTKDGPKTLRNFYVVFMLSYIEHCFVNFYYDNLISEFGRELIYDWSALIWDALPITCLLIFHFKNYKPYQHELIIRMQNSDSSMASMDDNQQHSNDEMVVIQDGLMG